MIRVVSRVGKSFMPGVFFSINEHKSPNVTPNIILVVVIKRKLIIIFVASITPKGTSPCSFSYKISSTARNMTIETASLITPSPKRMEFSLGYFVSLTILTAATVSVADRTQARRRHSFADRAESLASAPLKLKNTAKVLNSTKLIKVPTNP